MGMHWTEEQQKVISLRDRDILVSAAAGSGKTAVLVQRILEKIMDREKPVDIDRLLIMTFTRAAAGEMRERIAKALDKALQEDPENEHLQRQTTLIHTAQITTIDGFCAYVIKNYFHLIGLDPGYRIADEGEQKLLREDVLKELLERAYGEKDEAFVDFVECYAHGKNDEGLKTLILELYEAAMSNPWPLEWLEDCMNPYRPETVEEMLGSGWFSLLWVGAKEDIREAKAVALRAKKICGEPGGPWQYEETIDSDLQYLSALEQASEAEDYPRMRQLLGENGFARLSAKKAPDVDERKKEQVKGLREEVKTAVKELFKGSFQNTEKELFEMLTRCKKPLSALVELTREFIRMFGEAKREKNLLDFGDMEHFALEILIKKEDGVLHMTQAAQELSLKYDEVLVDEYQDSNFVQELLTNCVSGWADQRRNTFMVGDVKQSIYRFRLARPELFMEKYRRYTTTDGPEQRIDLHKNFRSRAEVLSGVNYIFRQIMGQDLGGIAYDEDAALYPGAVFPEGGNMDHSTEVLLVESDGEELLDEAETAVPQELEALAVAQRIREMVGREEILDKETGAYRPVEYGDIAVLLRTSQGWAETFSEIFSAQGIPSYTASRTGYFSATEVVTVLNYLRICDNPLQDIPLAGVLRSPIVGCTSQELAILRSEHKEGRLYESVLSFLEDGQMELFASERQALREKLSAFVELLTEMRAMAAYTPVHRLIHCILERTGYGAYAGALPNGIQRSANLSMLEEKAMDYEKTSYRGLFNFVRYMEHLQKYEIDFGEVNLSSGTMGAVQIMTIHKSKGLEFPVVFVCSMGKQFNFRDMNASLLIHPDLGFGADAILPERRLTVPSPGKRVVRRTILKESLGEELRVLYVALTRAKEKLILTGTVKQVEKQMAALAADQGSEELLSLGARMKAKNFWAYVLPALSRHRCMEELLGTYGFVTDRKNPLYHADAPFKVRLITSLEMAEKEVERGAEAEMKKEVFVNWDCERVYDAEIRKELEKRFQYKYPFAALRDIPAKVSVSELKKRSYQGEYEREEALFYEPDIIPLIPDFMKEKAEEYEGAARGTAYHRLMECLDYGRTDTDENLSFQLEEMVASKKMQEAEAACIALSDIRGFLDSPIGGRMKEAALAGRLLREQPFVLSIPASELDPAWDPGENVLVQGIIDACFLEDGDFVLVDYKTDRVRPGEEQRLVELYHVQLEDYAQALTRLTGKTVKEKYIYSFTLGKEIPV